MDQMPRSIFIGQMHADGLWWLEVVRCCAEHATIHGPYDTEAEATRVAQCISDFATDKLEDDDHPLTSVMVH